MTETIPKEDVLPLIGELANTTPQHQILDIRKIEKNNSWYLVPFRTPSVRGGIRRQIKVKDEYIVTNKYIEDESKYIDGFITRNALLYLVVFSKEFVRELKE